MVDSFVDFALPKHLPLFSLSEREIVKLCAFLSYFICVIFHKYSPHNGIQKMYKNYTSGSAGRSVNRKHIVLTITQKGKIFQKLDKCVSGYFLHFNFISIVLNCMCTKVGGRDQTHHSGRFGDFKFRFQCHQYLWFLHGVGRIP